jgi:hypothetical protein
VHLKAFNGLMSMIDELGVDDDDEHFSLLLTTLSQLTAAALINCDDKGRQAWFALTQTVMTQMKERK